MSYWVAVVARNAAATITQTLNSILNQTLPAEQIVVIDDGSRDATAETLSEYEHSKRGLVRVITLPDRGYDIRRVPANINSASKFALESDLKTDFLMISGDDCTYPRNYADSLIRRMDERPDIVVASGRPSSGGVTHEEHTPSGSGRMIKYSYWNEIGKGYPIRAGWETWLLYKAQEKGLKVKLYDDLIFQHERPRGAKHQFVYWGAAMGTLGYHPFYAIGRIVKNLIAKSITTKGALNLFRGYFQAILGSADLFLTPFDPSLRKFVRTSQIRRMQGIIRSFVGFASP